MDFFYISSVYILMHSHDDSVRTNVAVFLWRSWPSFLSLIIYLKWNHFYTNLLFGYEGILFHCEIKKCDFSVIKKFVCLMVFNATFSNISVILWRSVLLVEETGVPGENHWPVASYWQSLSHNVVSSTLTIKPDSNSDNVSGDRHYWLHR
jgi:hypothetical protein